MKMTFNNPTRIHLLLFAISLCFCQLVFAKNYIAIVDAGSSGSRLYFYSYQTAEKDNFAQLKLLHSKKLTPGLSYFASNPSSAAKHLANLLDYEQLSDDEKTADFYLLATAGMRLLPKEQQDAIYHQLSAYLKQNTTLTIKEITTITGKWEGIFNWIAANYWNKTLIPGKTVGVMDMGGASAQITFATESSADDGIEHLNLNDQSFSVYSQSDLGLGANQARNQYLNQANCFPVNYILPNDKLANGDESECIKHVEPLIEGVHDVHHYLPFINNDMPFIAVSAYYYLAKALSLGNHFSNHDLQTSATSFCAHDWSQLKETFPNDSHLSEYCYNASLISALLSQGYRFADDKTIAARNQIDGHEINWTTGAIIFYLAATSK